MGQAEGQRLPPRRKTVSLQARCSLTDRRCTATGGPSSGTVQPLAYPVSEVIRRLRPRRYTGERDHPGPCERMVCLAIDGGWASAAPLHARTAAFLPPPFGNVRYSPRPAHLRAALIAGRDPHIEPGRPTMENAMTIRTAGHRSPDCGTDRLRLRPERLRAAAPADLSWRYRGHEPPPSRHPRDRQRVRGGHLFPRPHRGRGERALTRCSAAPREPRPCSAKRN